MAILAFGLSGIALVTLLSCRQQPATTTVQPPPVAVPAPVIQALRGRKIAAAVATSTGPYSVGLGVLGNTTASAPATFTVVTWVSSESTQTRLLAGGKLWEIANVFVTDSKGGVMFDDGRSKVLIRGGGPVFESIGGGHVFQYRTTFSLDRPGQYSVAANASFRIRKLEATGNVLTSDQFDAYSPRTPSIQLNVR